jgi:hypothetical protein
MVGMGVHAVFLTSYLVVVDPQICVLAPDWSELSFLRSMMCPSWTPVWQHVSMWAGVGPTGPT